jgi:hypothetical protein
MKIKLFSLLITPIFLLQSTCLASLPSHSEGSLAQEYSQSRYLTITNKESGKTCLIESRYDLMPERLSVANDTTLKLDTDIERCSEELSMDMSMALRMGEDEVQTASLVFAGYFAGTCAVSAGITYATESGLLGTAGGSVSGTLLGVGISKIDAVVTGAKLAASSIPGLAIASLATAAVCSSGTKFLIRWFK